MPELRRRICRAADKARAGMAAGIILGEAPGVRQAGASQLFPRRYRYAFAADSRYCARAALRRDLSFGRPDRPLDFAEADPVTVPLAPAAYRQRIPVFEKRPDNPASQ